MQKWKDIIRNLKIDFLLMKIYYHFLEMKILLYTLDLFLQYLKYSIQSSISG